MTSSASGTARGRVALVVLGCSKNQVEAESMSSRLAGLGWELTADAAEADVTVVHTCGFLEAARREATDAVFRLRRSAPRTFLVMTGCFAQFLNGKHPAGVDAVLGTGQFHRLPELIEKKKGLRTVPASPGGFHGEGTPRPLLRGQLSSYLRISEGCRHRCTFCLIPQLRGELKSRPPADVLSEARGLMDRGIRELVVISQDTTGYGGDLRPSSSINDLLKKMASWNDLKRIRLMYAYPSEVGERLIRLLAEEPKLCGYLDMPLQHLSDPILKAMGREWGETRTRSLLDQMEKKVPHLALRTTFMVGFPGETDEDFRKMLGVVEEGRFEHVGVFAYSPEERSPSARRPGRVPPALAEERMQALLHAQSVVMARRAKKRNGAQIEVMVESSPDGWTARAPWQAPEVDGQVILDRYPDTEGFYQAKITGMKGIDLKATLSPKERGKKKVLQSSRRA